MYLLSCGAENAEEVQFFEDVLVSLDARYNLILADWWRSIIIDLMNRAAVRGYLARSLTE